VGDGAYADSFGLGFDIGEIAIHWHGCDHFHKALLKEALLLPWIPEKVREREREGTNIGDLIGGVRHTSDTTGSLEHWA